MLNLTDYLASCRYSDFTYWFQLSSNIDGYAVIDKSNGSIIGFMKVENNIVTDNVNGHFIPVSDNVIEDGILDDWKMFMRRPEYIVGRIPVEVVEEEVYDKMLIGCIMIKYTRNWSKEFSDESFNPDYCTKGVHAAINWLHTTDFYTAPASSRYHDCNVGGLVSHTLKVVKRMTDIMKMDTFNTKVTLEDAVFVSLIHDWCKIGLYESYMRNVKDENGKWVQKPEFKYRDTSLTCFGHGVSSMFLAQKFFKLSIGEALAIRWHMGFCRVADSDMNELQQANETYPIVHLLQFADQLSITNY